MTFKKKTTTRTTTGKRKYTTRRRRNTTKTEMVTITVPAKVAFHIGYALGSASTVSK